MELAKRIFGIPQAWWRVSDSVGQVAGNFTENFTHQRWTNKTVRYLIAAGIFVGVPTAGVLAIYNLTYQPAATLSPELVNGLGSGGEALPTIIPLPTAQVIFQATKEVIASTLTPVQAAVKQLTNQGFDCKIIDSQGLRSAFEAAMEAGKNGVLEAPPYAQVLNDGRSFITNNLPPLVHNGNAICVKP